MLNNVASTLYNVVSMSNTNEVADFRLGIKTTLINIQRVEFAIKRFVASAISNLFITVTKVSISVERQPVFSIIPFESLGLT